MKSATCNSAITDCRAAFCEWYKTPLGQRLRMVEAKYLAQALKITYKQLILQIGSLGWEDQFLDQDFFRNIRVIDKSPCSHSDTAKITAKAQELPIASESIDVVIMPHTLEFESDQHQVLREAERILKPEGQLFLLGFNPWSVYGLLKLCPPKRKKAPWCGQFISHRRALDWLSLLQFQGELSAGFDSRSVRNFSTLRICKGKCTVFVSLAYAIKAIKRTYKVIPIDAVSVKKRQLIPADVVEPTTREIANG